MDGDAPRGVAGTKSSSGPLRVMAAMLSHAGCVRSGNEDTVIYSVPAKGGPSAAHGVLLLVADGMGGHAAVEVASQNAARLFRYFAAAMRGVIPKAGSASLTEAPAARRT